MRRLVGLIAILGLVGVSSFAEARGPRGGNVVSTDGVLYNTNSPEWRASGGSMAMYEQIMQNKMMMQQQQMMLMQQQLMQKAQQQQAKGKATGFNGSTLNGGINNGTPFVPDFGTAKPKKKRRTYDPTHPVTSQAKSTKADPKAAKVDPPASTTTPSAPKIDAPKS